MPTSKTKELAKKLGLLKRKRKAENEVGGSRKRRKGQILSYVIVIDFESTCWKDKKGTQEIIEFPAVLLDLQTGDIVDEFQEYVQPQECPVLSNFCKELTGISQAQVDGGVPLPTCLYLFGRWVKSLREEKEVRLMEPGEEYSSCADNLCAIATWSDWDLGVCLQYECRRKQIRKPPYFDQWIDLRVVYKQFYDRRPSGLCGSLEDLGIPFTGREHCGLDDARNTAKLCYRLVKDGCRLNITKSLWKKRSGSQIRAPDLLEENKRIPEQSTALKPKQQGNQPLLNNHKPITTVEESPTEGEKENTIETAPVEVSSGAQLPITAGEEQQEGGSPSDESFLNGIANELDELERNNYSEAPANSKCMHTDRCSLTKDSKAVLPTSNTPSRSNFLSHIAPVTLLPPHHSNNSTTISSTHQRHLPSGTSASGHGILQPSSSVAHKPKPPTPVQQQALAIPTTTTMSHRVPSAAANSGQNQKEGPSSFRTPSTTQWIKAKSFQSTSSSLTLSCDSPQPFNGGKLTPPLCKCGKRAKRKMVTSPGPNQGRPFFSCPGGRTSGCQYFRWETPSPSGSPHSDTAGNLSSEYS